MSQHLGDRAAAYVDGVLGPDETARARAHLAGCAECRARVTEQERVRDLLRSAGRPVAGPPEDLMAVLVSMPVAGLPVQPAPATGPRRATVVRRTAVSCVAVTATVLGTAWVVGGQPVTASGPPAVSPSSLLAQHSATAGELPFWGARSEASSTSNKKSLVGARDTDSMARWVTRDPSEILRTAAEASSHLSYQAVEQVTTYAGTASVTQVSQVSHLSGQGTSTRLLGASPGRAVFQPQVVGRASSSLDAVALLQRTYRVAGEGSDVVAGRLVDRLAVYGGDGQLVARFWIDRDTGLPLAREVRRDGRPAVANRITALSVADGDTMSAHLPPSNTSLWGEAVGIPATAALETLDARGWYCPDTLAARTGLEAFDVLLADGDASGSQGQVLHIIYTDGLRAVSVFQQRAALRPKRLVGFGPAVVGGAPVYRKDGDPTEITWSTQGMVFTVVGDVPEPVLDTIVAELPHETTGLGTRTGRGLSRVGSWIDPFG